MVAERQGLVNMSGDGSGMRAAWKVHWTRERASSAWVYLLLIFWRLSSSVGEGRWRGFDAGARAPLSVPPPPPPPRQRRSPYRTTAMVASVNRASTSDCFAVRAAVSRTEPWWKRLRAALTGGEHLASRNLRSRPVECPVRASAYTASATAARKRKKKTPERVAREPWCPRRRRPRAFSCVRPVCAVFVYYSAAGGGATLIGNRSPLLSSVGPSLPTPVRAYRSPRFSPCGRAMAVASFPAGHCSRHGVDRQNSCLPAVNDKHVRNKGTPSNAESGEYLGRGRACSARPIARLRWGRTQVTRGYGLPQERFLSPHNWRKRFEGGSSVLLGGKLLCRFCVTETSYVDVNGIGGLASVNVSRETLFSLSVTQWYLKKYVKEPKERYVFHTISSPSNTHWWFIVESCYLTLPNW